MTWTIWPREADLSRLLDPISVYTKLTVVERHISNGPATWVLEGPSESLSVFTPGMGCILFDGDAFVGSGQLQEPQRGYEAGDDGEMADTTTLGFVDDTDELWSRLAWPDPAHALSGIPTAFATTYDTRTGPRETILLEYIAANLGPAAPIASRRLSSLFLPTSLGRGGSTTYQARMETLGDIAGQLGEAGGFDVHIRHDEPAGVPRLNLVIEAVQDVSDDVVFGYAEAARATGIVSSWRYSMSAPELTDAILFSSGDLELREGSRFTDEAAVTRWGRRREKLIDQGYTDDLSVITDAGAKALEDGASPVEAVIQVTDAGDAIYRSTYHLGDRVGIELPNLPLEIASPRVREVVTTVVPNQKDERVIAVGGPGATSIEPPDAASLTKAMRRVAKLERNH